MSITVDGMSWRRKGCPKIRGWMHEIKEAFIERVLCLLNPLLSMSLEICTDYGKQGRQRNW